MYLWKKNKKSPRKTGRQKRKKLWNEIEFLPPQDDWPLPLPLQCLSLGIGLPHILLFAELESDQFAGFGVLVGGTPLHIFDESSSPQCPPILVAGVWPQGGAEAVWAGTEEPDPLFMRRLFSQISVPILTGARQTADGWLSLPLSGGGVVGTSHGESWFTD